MFAGVPGRGAEEGWYLTSLCIELARLEGRHITGGSADVMKCFDQIQRPLLYELLRMSGLPSDFVNLYQDMLDNLQVVNNISGYIGEPHRHPCGIPQGCPLSMTFIGLLFRPWILRMQQLGVTPRVLADDILITAEGNNQYIDFCAGYDATIEYVTDIGGKLAPDKSVLFSTSRVTRRSLRLRSWRRLCGTRIQVKCAFRDLGTHINLGMRQAGATINDRMKAACSTAERIVNLPMTNAKKQRILRGLTLAKALYGTEAAPPSCTAIAHLRAVMVDALGFRGHFTCAELAFQVSQVAGELDPLINIFVRRATLLRRIIARFPDVRHIARLAIRIYGDLAMPGTSGALGLDKPKAAACWGPIGLLLTSMAQHNCVLSEELKVTPFDSCTDFDLMGLPSQDF